MQIYLYVMYTCMYTVHIKCIYVKICSIYVYIANLHIMILYAKLCVMSLRVYNTHMGLLYTLICILARCILDGPVCVFAYRHVDWRVVKHTSYSYPIYLT